MKGLVAQRVFTMTEGFGLGGNARGCIMDALEDVGADVVEGKACCDDGTGIDVHIICHVLIGLRIGTDFNDRGDGRTCHRATTCGVEHHMTTTGYHLHDFCVVVDVGETPAGLTVRYDIHHPQACCAGSDARIGETLDRT